MGVSPDVWGPSLWGAFHALCLTGTITSEFVQEFANVIPCPACAMHFRDILETFPFEQAEDKFQWSVRIHNQVNERLGKPIVRVEEARVKWSSRPCSQFDFKILLIILVVLVLIFMYLRK
jgi:hypothetical protein